MSAESTKEATAEGHKVTTVVEGTDATAAPPAGKVAIVTGASRGLGKGVATVLANEAGFTVYATGRTTADLEQLQAECAAGPGAVIPCTLDLKDDAAVKAFVEQVKNEAVKMDVLVNSAYQGLAAQKQHLGKKVLRAAARGVRRPPERRALGLRPGAARGASHGRSEARPHLECLVRGQRYLFIWHAVRRDARGHGPAGGGHGHGIEGDERGLHCGPAARSPNGARFPSARRQPSRAAPSPRSPGQGISPRRAARSS